jgi:hypothetical protein
MGFNGPGVWWVSFYDEKVLGRKWRKDIGTNDLEKEKRAELSHGWYTRGQLMCEFGSFGKRK